jgi:L,D-transpeptidase catalytic domain
LRQIRFFLEISMRRWFGAAIVAGFGFAGFVADAGPAGAEVVIAIDKAAQRMAVLVDGKQQHVWKVSTGTGGAPKAGTYQPQRLEKSWFSRKYDMSPMPHSIFFDEGIAIHGTQYVSRLGTIASHGCVRLHPANAATLFNLVRTQGMAATTIVVTHSGWPDIAKAGPKPAPKLEAKPGAEPTAKPEPPALASAGPEPVALPAAPK